MDLIRDAFANSPQTQVRTIFTVSETGLKSDVPTSAMEVDGYNVFRRDHSTSKGGGIESLRKDIEVIWLELRFRCKRPLNIFKISRSFFLKLPMYIYMYGPEIK